MKLAVVILLFCLSAQGGMITDAALGSQLVGGIVEVIRFGGSRNSATFVVDSVTGAIASESGSGGFSLTVSPGDTAAATWTLSNTDPSLIFFNVITTVTIDLTFSDISLFDSGSLPSTPASGAGVAGVTCASGVAILSSEELLPWSEPANAGDMYRATSITFSGGLAAGASSAWMDDTDVITSIPEPSQAAVLAPSLLTLLWVRAGRRRVK